MVTADRNRAPEHGVVQCIYHVGRLAEFMRSGEYLLEHLNELIADEELIRTIEASVAPVETWGTKRFTSLFDFRLYRIVLYAVLRATRPEVAVETGVLHGLTTIFLLRALERNGRGRLVSIDLPSYPSTGPSNQDGYNAVLPAGRQPGWVVPPGGELASRWDLRLGSSRDLLPALARETGEIGFFCHDSDHTFSTMWFELEWAWERLARGGVLICDNIEASLAFQELCRRVGQVPLMFPAPDSRAHEQPRFALVFKP